MMLSQDTQCTYSTRLSYTSGKRTFLHVDFISCSSSNEHGGAIKCTGDNTELNTTECTFTGCYVNTLSNFIGGGIFAASLASLTIKSCFFLSCSGN